MNKKYEEKNNYWQSFPFGIAYFVSHKCERHNEEDITLYMPVYHVPLHTLGARRKACGRKSRIRNRERYASLLLPDEAESYLPYGMGEFRY